MRARTCAPSLCTWIWRGAQTFLLAPSYDLQMPVVLAGRMCLDYLSRLPGPDHLPTPKLQQQKRARQLFRLQHGTWLRLSVNTRVDPNRLAKTLVEYRPDFHHSDKDLEWAATVYTELLRTHGAKISISEGGKPTQYGDLERLRRTIQNDKVDLDY